MSASDYRYCISHRQACNAGANVTPAIKKQTAQVLLHSFVDKGWLAKSAKGYYSLSVRSLQELETYLNEEFEEDLHECTVCQEIVTVVSAAPFELWLSKLISRFQGILLPHKQLPVLYPQLLSRRLPPKKCEMPGVSKVPFSTV